jgi:tRNA threonylcarbamoyladenosine biosynthesis protein TsaE
MKIMRERSASAEETRALGARLARIAEPGDVFSLDGEVGSGKTEFVRGFVNALAVEDAAAAADAPASVPENSAAPEAVRSPTFSIVNTYETPKFPVHHFDFYRIENPEELESIGLGEYLGGDGVCLIEWGGMFPGALPDEAKLIRFSDNGETARIVEANFLF